MRWIGSWGERSRGSKSDYPGESGFERGYLATWFMGGSMNLGGIQMIGESTTTTPLQRVIQPNNSTSPHHARPPSQILSLPCFTSYRNFHLTVPRTHNHRSVLISLTSFISSHSYPVQSHPLPFPQQTSRGLHRSTPTSLLVTRTGRS